MAALFSFEVHTPYRLFFCGRVQTVILELTDGEIGIYANHSPFIAPVVSCIFRIKDADGNWRRAFVSSGILEIKEYKSVLMADAAEWPEEIDMERALESKQQAEQALKDIHFKFETDKAKEKLRRAEYRLKAAQEHQSTVQRID